MFSEQGERILINTPSEQNAPVVVVGGVNRATKILQTIPASNGVIYLIDDVIVPPISLSRTAEALGWSGYNQTVASAQLDGVMDNLRNKTFFVPTNAAIEKLIKQVTNAGMNLIVSSLSVIIDNHIHSGAKLASELVDLANKKVTLTTVLPGEKLTLAVVDDQLTIKGDTGFDVAISNVIISNILVTGGIAHVIDSVLVPSNKLLIASLTQKGPTIPN